MSASEKLAKLEARRPDGWQESMTVGGSLIYALPQILALVEAAERTTAAYFDAKPETAATAAVMSDQTDALTALEEALP